MAWKVAINQHWNNPGAADVIIYREAGGDKIQVLYIEDAKTWTVSVKEFSAAAVVEPSLRLPAGVLEALMAGLQEHGIKPPGEHKIAGLYEATKYHLEDLRGLLKLNGGVKK
jgi:hypothetical protein